VNTAIHYSEHYYYTYISIFYRVLMGFGAMLHVLNLNMPHLTL